MDLIYRHIQEKKDRRSDAKSLCELRLYYNETNLEYIGTFDFDYSRYGSKKHVIFEHSLLMDIKSSDITVTYKIINNGLTDDKMFKTSTKSKKNDFKMLYELSESGFVKGEKRNHFWGVKYERAIETIENYIIDILTPLFKTDYNSERINKTCINRLYDTILNYHLDIKGIKGHDNIHLSIQDNYPKKIYLKRNNNKYIPAILDSYGIKSKYLVSELNKTEQNINLSSLNYICKLFGENYIDYIKQFDWKKHCLVELPSKKIHSLKNDSEKSFMIKVINDWENEIKLDGFIDQTIKLLSIREMLEKREVILKFSAKNVQQYDLLFETWSGIKLHFARGFKVKYNIDSDFVKLIESEIMINDEVFKPKILLSEEDYRIEGYKMKNCMSKQFIHGVLYIYVSLENKRKRINLQYRKGVLVQTYAKANTPTPDFFKPAIEILTKRFETQPDITWRKEKYDLLSH